MNRGIFAVALFVSALGAFADEQPKQDLREEGVYSVNRRNELTWTLPLKASEEKVLHYAYTVLVE